MSRYPSPFLARLAKLLIPHGWTVDLTGKTHAHWRSPEGELVVTSKSPKNNDRTFYNARSIFRRYGAPI